MADAEKQLLIRIDATTAALRVQMAQAEDLVAKKTASIERQLGRIDKGFASVGKGVGLAKTAIIGFGAGFAGGLISSLPGTLLSAASASLELGSSLSEASQQLGVTVEDLQKYRFIADVSGISQEEMDKGLQRLTRTLGAAAAGVIKPSAAFEELGIAVRDGNGHIKNAGAVLPELVAKLSAIKDPAERARIEVALFGKAGQQLDTLLAGGTAALDSLSKAYERMGIALTSEQAKKLDDAADKLAALKTQLQGKITVYLAEHADDLISAANSVGHLAEEILKLVAALERLDKVRKSIPGLGAPTRGLIGTPQGGSGLLFDLPGTATPAAPRRTGGTIRTTPANVPASVFDRAPTIGKKAPAGVFGLAGFAGLAGIDFTRVANDIGGVAPAIDRVAVSVARANPELDKLLDSIRDQIEAGPAPQSRFAQLISDQGVGDFDVIIDEIDRAKQARFDVEEEAAQLRDDHIRESARIYYELFDGGTRRFLDDFKHQGLAVAAEIVARLIAGQSLGQASTGAIDAVGGIFRLFGGFRANGGPVSAGTPYVVGESGRELFVPKLPGTIISNDNFRGMGGGSPVSLTVNAPGATAETVALIRRELAQAAPVIAQAASRATLATSRRPRL